MNEKNKLLIELMEAWEGEGNSKKISFNQWVQEMAENPNGTLQQAAIQYAIKSLYTPKKKVLQLHFTLGVDRGLVVYASLPKDVVKRVAEDKDVQLAVKNRKGSGYYAISEVYADTFVSDEESLKQECLKVTNFFK